MKKTIVSILIATLALTMPATASTVTVSGVAAEDVLSGPDGEVSAHANIGIGPQPGQCHATADVEASDTGGSADASCQDPGSSDASTNEGVFYGTAVITYEPSEGCFLARAPSIAATTVDDVAPQNDDTEPFLVVLPSPTSTIRWGVTALDLDLYEITITVEELCQDGTNTLTKTWLQRA